MTSEFITHSIFILLFSLVFVAIALKIAKRYRVGEKLSANDFKFLFLFLPPLVLFDLYLLHAVFSIEDAIPGLFCVSITSMLACEVSRGLAANKSLFKLFQVTYFISSVFFAFGAFSFLEFIMRPA